jgi:outer membrane cobalamin receptor
MNENTDINKSGKAIIILLITLFAFSFSQAQNDSIKTLELPEFSVSGKLDKMYSKINTQTIDSIVLAQNATNNLSTLLSKNSAVTIRSYGVTGLSSISMRGGNSNHTAVLWNGFNLQDPLNGGFNSSATSINLIDEVNIQYGGSSTAFGSGAIGGTIHLNNIAQFNRKINGSVLYKNGSFGLNSINASIGFGGKKIASRLRLYKTVSKNNFDFVNVSKIGKPTEQYTNSAIKQYGVLQETYFQLKENQLLSSQLWYQNTFREIPPNSTASSENIDDYQKNQWYRWALNYTKKGDRLDYEARTGFFYSNSNYHNSSIKLDAEHTSLKNTTEALATVKIIKKQKITFGINNDYTVGVSDNFIDNPSVNSTAFYLAPSFTILKRITLNISIRDEIYNSELKPITYSINNKYKFYKGLSLTASFSKNYRTPTFNDLFWSGGFAQGNLDLEDEYGYSKDIGIELKHIKEKINIKSNLSFFQNIINNQIQWISEGQNWTPKNIKLVETNGVEFTLTSNYQLTKGVYLDFNVSYAYTDAQTKEKASNEGDDILNKQLIYIPIYQGNGMVGIRYKNFSIGTNIQYVDYQFTRADNLEWIEPFIITDIETGYRLNLKSNSILLSAKINNVFDAVYEVRQWYPMPGINYEIGIKLNIN